MKWWIVIGLLFLLAGYAPQLTTKLRPAYPAVRRVKRSVCAIPVGRGVVFFGYARAI